MRKDNQASTNIIHRFSFDPNHPSEVKLFISKNAAAAVGSVAEDAFKHAKKTVVIIPVTN